MKFKVAIGLVPAFLFVRFALGLPLHASAVASRDASQEALYGNVCLVVDDPLGWAIPFADTVTERPVQRIAEKIVRGLTNTFPDHQCSIARESDNFDLPAWVTRAVDNDALAFDSYWQYYQDCDRWNVSLGLGNHVRRTLLSGEPQQAFAGLSHGWSWLKRQTGTIQHQLNRWEYILIEATSDPSASLVAARHQSKPSISQSDPVTTAPQSRSKRKEISAGMTTVWDWLYFRRIHQPITTIRQWVKSYN